jgi:2-methylisocitrate lyase-like PEP mutase family enzyme
MVVHPSSSDRCREFRRLHEAGCFVIPNPWDLGSARVLAQLGFPALATTSSGFAWSLGRRDNQVSLDDALNHFRSIARGVPVPVNGDFEGGFARDPDGVAEHVTAAASTGVAGISIEDSTGEVSSPLFEFDLAVERIRAARHAIDRSGANVLLTGRSEGFIVGRPDLSETIRRLTAYADAGADCLYAPGLRTRADVEAVVRAVAPKPVNVLVSNDSFTVAQLAEAAAVSFAEVNRQFEE